MKKAVITVFIVVAVLVGALVAVPLFFKQDLIDATKAEINRYVDAKVEFDDFSLSLFAGFPKLTLGIDGLSVVGKGEFSNDTLLFVSKASATTSLSSLFKKNGISIEKIILEKPALNLLVSKSGKTNWDVVNGQEQENPSNEPVESEEPLNLQLNSIVIDNGSFRYNDREAKLDILLDDIDFDISGKMYGTETGLTVSGKTGSFGLQYDGVNYISNVALETNSVLNIDYEQMKISIAENRLLVNKLELELTGDMEIPSDTVIINMQFKTKKSDFNSFLALVPPGYEKYLKDITATGFASVTGYLKGSYAGDTYPAFMLKTKIADGNFQYAGLPEKIKNIKADVEISKPQGVLNLTRILVKDAHAEIKNNPVDLTLKMDNLVSDIRFDGAFVGKIDFDHLKDVLPLDSVNVSGVIDANLFAKGNYSAIEKEEYNKIKSDGVILLDNFVYDSPGLSQSVRVPKGEMYFSPQNISLKQFRIKTGKSDFNLSGKLTGYLNYIFKDGILKGNLSLYSNFTDLNELLRLQKNSTGNNNASDNKNGSDINKQNTDTLENIAFDIPENIDITFRSKIKHAQFDRLPINDVNGAITAKNGKLVLNGLNMKMLGGEMRVNGSYRNSGNNQPFVDFGMAVINFDIPTAYRSLTGFRRMFPGAGSSTGKFSTEFKLNGRLTPALGFIPSSVNGEGNFGTRNLQIINSQIFSQLKGILKADKLKNVVVDDFKANFNIVSGNIDLRPFKTKVAGQQTTVKAALSAENLINMRIDFDIQRSAFGPDIQNILGLIPGNEKIKVVPAGVLITGQVGKPDVKMDLSETRKTIMNTTKDDIKKSINDIGNGILKLFK